MKNIGSPDRVIRVVVGLLLLFVALFTAVLGAGVLKWIAVLVGLVLIATAALGVCPAYSLLGVNTCQRR